MRDAARRKIVRAALWSLGFPQAFPGAGAEGRYTVESPPCLIRPLRWRNWRAQTAIFRTRQLMALVEAGVVKFIGGYPLLDTDRYW